LDVCRVDKLDGKNDETKIISILYIHLILIFVGLVWVKTWVIMETHSNPWAKLEGTGWRGIGGQDGGSNSCPHFYGPSFFN
jgi:hypothetical protein